MVVDSAGHTFGGFAKTDGQLYGSIWARAADVKANGREKDDEYWVYAMGRGQQYMPRNSGLLGMPCQCGDYVQPRGDAHDVPGRAAGPLSGHRRRGRGPRLRAMPCPDGRKCWPTSGSWSMAN